jgi:hypothetical protein
MTESFDVTAEVEKAFGDQENADLMDKMRLFAFGNREVIETDRPTSPDWGGVPIPVAAQEPEKEKKETGGENRPFFIPEVEDRERGEGGVFGNAVQASVNGMIEGVNNTLEAAYQAARFWDDRFGGRVLPDELPDIPKPFDVPDTTVNGIVSSVAQFVLPFSVAGKAMSAAKLGTNVAASFPKAMKVVRPMIQGAIADFSAFDAHESRLSNLIQSAPVLKNPVTEYLAANDNDGQLEGRFKNAVEGIGLGALTDAFVKSVKAVKAARAAKAKAKAEGLKDVADLFVPKVEKEDFAALGDIDADVVGKAKRDVFVNEEVAETAARSQKENIKDLINPDFDKETDRLFEIRAEGKNVSATADVGKVSEELAFLAQKNISIDISRFRHNIDTSSVGHVKKNHGNAVVEGKRGQIAVTKDDFKIVPQIIYDWDYIAFGAKDPKNLNLIVYAKNMPDGSSLYLEEVRTGRKTLTTKSLRKYKTGVNPDSFGARLSDNVRGDTGHVTIISKGDLEKNSFFRDAQIKENERVIKSFTDIDFSAGEAPVLSYEVDVRQPAAGRLSVVNTKNNIAKSAGNVNPDEKVYINFARIDAPEDIKKVMDELAQGAKKDINIARRGRQTFEEIKLNAEQEDAFKILTQRRAGEPLNAEQSYAARQLWAASAEKLKELSKLALQNPSEANKFMLRKQMATHAAVQKEIIAARTETARALAQWKIPAGSPAETYQAMKAVLDDAGGDMLTKKMAEDILKMNEKGLVNELDKVIEGGWGAKAFNTWNEARIAGLLTSPTTHIVNFASNMMNIGVAMVDDVFTAGTAKMLGRDTSAAATDALLRFQGVVEGLKDGLRCAWKTVRTGASENPYATKFDMPPAIRSETYGLDKDGFWGKSVDFIGKIIRIPFSALEASDDFAKAVHGRGALYVNAAQKARNEVFNGMIAKDAFKKRVAELVENPDSALLDAAKRDAAYLTFTGDPTKTTRLLGQLAQANPLIRFFMPFTKTPGNVFDFAAQHSVFAPISSKFRADIAAGGARAQRAVGQMTAGVALSMVGMDLALNGLITGGGPAGAQRQALIRTGWQPYSVKIGDTYYSYQRFEPVATDLSLMADFADFLTATRHDDINFDENDDADAAIMAAILALKVGNAVLNKTYMSGMMDIVTAVAEPTEGKARKIAADALMSFVPFASSSVAFSGAVARTTDPFAKDARSTVDAMKAGLPGFSKDVPDRLDLFGRKILRATGNTAYDMFVPVRKSPESQDPIDKEMLAQGAFVPMPNRKISMRGGVINLKYRPELYNEYVALAGNEFKMMDGLGAKDYLNAVVTGKIDVGYQNMNDGGFDAAGSKANFIREVVNGYRRAAQAELVRRHPELLVELHQSVAKKYGAQ